MVKSTDLIQLPPSSTNLIPHTVEVLMHPTRLHKITDEDFESARERHRRLRAEAWRRPGSKGKLQPGPIA